MIKKWRLVAVVFLMAAGAGCTASNDKTAYKDESVEFLYNKAMDSAAAGNYRTAAPLFDEVERQHPYSVWATQAQLGSTSADGTRLKHACVNVYTQSMCFFFW